MTPKRSSDGACAHDCSSRGWSTIKDQYLKLAAAVSKGEPIEYNIDFGDYLAAVLQEMGWQVRDRRVEFALSIFVHDSHLAAWLQRQDWLDRLMKGEAGFTMHNGEVLKTR